MVSMKKTPKPMNHPFEAGRVSTIELIFSVTVPKVWPGSMTGARSRSVDDLYCSGIRFAGAKARVLFRPYAALKRRSSTKNFFIHDVIVRSALALRTTLRPSQAGPPAYGCGNAVCTIGTPIHCIGAAVNVRSLSPAAPPLRMTRACGHDFNSGLGLRTSAKYVVRGRVFNSPSRL